MIFNSRIFNQRLKYLFIYVNEFINLFLIFFESIFKMPFINLIFSALIKAYYKIDTIKDEC